MKGKVFIGWCGSTALADDVKKKLKDADFEGIRGGESRTDNYIFLGQTILKEIDNCNQAVFIFQKKDDGSISASTLFELGYALARLETNKIHVFYIDIPEKDQSIPSDLEGIWAEHLYNVNDEQIDEKVVEKFLANQKKVFIGNKMNIINTYYEKRSAFEIYAERPFCSEYELAQHVLFFSQAAYMFNDVNEGLEYLKRLEKKLSPIGHELMQALRFGKAYLLFIQNIRSQGSDCIYITGSVYREARSAFDTVLNAISDWPDSEFKQWLEILTYEAMNYIRILRASDPELNPERRDSLLAKSVEYAEKTLEKCDELCGPPAREISDESTNEQCITLYRAYMFRNLSTAYLNQTVSDRTAANEYLMRSYQERKKLIEYYKVRTISSKILETIEMEYYLAISELLEYLEDEELREENMESCSDYLEKTQDLHKKKTVFINRIENNLRLAGGKIASMAEEDDD